MEVKTEPVERQWRLDIVWPRYAYIFCWLKSAFRECEKATEELKPKPEEENQNTWCPHSD